MIKPVSFKCGVKKLFLDLFFFLIYPHTTYFLPYSLKFVNVIEFIVSQLKKLKTDKIAVNVNCNKADTYSNDTPIFLKELHM